MAKRTRGPAKGNVRVSVPLPRNVYAALQGAASARTQEPHSINGHHLGSSGGLAAPGGIPATEPSPDAAVIVTGSLAEAARRAVSCLRRESRGVRPNWRRPMLGRTGGVLHRRLLAA